MKPLYIEPRISKFYQRTIKRGEDSMARRFLYLTIVAFFIALVHSCSLNNGIITPPCKVFEVDLTDRWWYPVSGSVDDGIFFASNGTCRKRNSDDNMTYTLQNCNRVSIQNHTQNSIEIMEIGKLFPDKMIILQGERLEKTYVLHPSR
jgi:hypothetical protein